MSRLQIVDAIGQRGRSSPCHRTQCDQRPIVTIASPWSANRCECKNGHLHAEMHALSTESRTHFIKPLGIKDVSDQMRPLGDIYESSGDSGFGVFSEHCL